MTGSGIDNPRLGIVFVLVAMLCISINDLLIKYLSGGYPLHEMILIRSMFGMAFSLVILQFEGGFAALRTRTPGLHVLRGLLIVAANLLFYAGLAVLPLGEVTALFFVAPLAITVLSIPFLGERVGPRRLAAVVLGFAGVLVMMRPWGGEMTGPRWVLILPVLAALAYAVMQILTRKLGIATRASALALYVQAMFILVSLCFWAVAGDGRFAEGQTSEIMVFMFRPWIWPDPGDYKLFVLLGCVAAIIGYCLSQAYRLSEAATVAPFEYSALPLAVFWGWLIFGELPDVWGFVGIALIAGAGLFVFLRERRIEDTTLTRGPGRRP